MKTTFSLPAKNFQIEAPTVELALRKLVLYLWGPVCTYAVMAEQMHMEECARFPILDIHYPFISRGKWIRNTQPNYIHHPFNAVAVCRTHHMEHGDTEDFRRFCWKLQSARYGVDYLIRYLTDAPTRDLDRFWLTEGYWTPVLN